MELSDVAYKINCTLSCRKHSLHTVKLLDNQITFLNFFIKECNNFDAGLSE